MGSEPTHDEYSQAWQQLREVATQAWRRISEIVSSHESTIASILAELQPDRRHIMRRKVRRMLTRVQRKD